MTSLPDSIPASLREVLRRSGVRSAEQALELSLRHPSTFAGAGTELARSITGLVAGARAEIIRLHRAPPMSFGVAGRYAPAGRGHRGRVRSIVRATARDGERMAAFLDRIRAALPERFFLTDYQAPIRSQGSLGSCTGWGSTAPREMLHRLGRPIGPFGNTVLSPRFAYELAKERDGHDGEGSWQRFVYDGMVEVGAVPESAFPYTDSSGHARTSHLHRLASRYRIPGYVDLLQDESWSRLHPDLIRATLAGFVTGGAQAVSISLLVTPDWGNHCATNEGVIFYNESARMLGGHALAVIGYYWDAAIGQYVFLLRNSWGTTWAARNPICPGCALVPENYLRDARMVWELLTPSAEVSPVSALGVLGSVVRRGWGG